jgi:hypothetical protein
VNPSRVLLAAAAAALLAGCAIQLDARSLGVPVTMAAPAGQVVPGDTFAVDTRAVHLLWGLVPVREPSLRQTLAGQLGTDGGVADLRITVHKGPLDLVFTVLTLGVISPTTVTFEGVLVRPRP